MTQQPNALIVFRSHADTLVMERLLDCLRWERTRKELANSQQAAERRSVLFRAVYCGQKFFRAVQHDDPSIVASIDK